MLLTIFLALAGRLSLNKQGSFYAGRWPKKCVQCQSTRQHTTVEFIMADNAFGYVQVKA